MICSFSFRSNVCQLANHPQSLCHVLAQQSNLPSKFMNMLARIKYKLLKINVTKGQEVIENFVFGERGGCEEALELDEYLKFSRDRQYDLYRSFPLRYTAIIDQASVTSYLQFFVCAAASRCRKKSSTKLAMPLLHCETLVFCSKITIRGAKHTVLKMSEPQILHVRSHVRSLS